jgi:hypothetical protein
VDWSTHPPVISGLGNPAPMICPSNSLRARDMATYLNRWQPWAKKHHQHADNNKFIATQRATKTHPKLKG